MAAEIVLHQTCMMFLMMLVGVILYRTGIISRQGSADLGKMLISVVIPCVIVRSYLTDYSTVKCIRLGYSFLFSALSLMLAMVISHLFFGKKARIENFSASFSNAGFMGIPLVQAVLGEEAVFCVAAYVALLNLLQWTYGVMVMSQKRESVKAKKIIGNPVMVSMVAGVFLFLTGLPVPGMAVTILEQIRNLNTPLAMIVLGVYFAQTDLKSMFLDKKSYLCSAVRLLLIPAVTILLWKLLPFGDDMVKMAVLIAASAPVGANVAIFAQQNDMDYTHACKVVCLSTLLSIVTIPGVIHAAELFL